jgi:hypothetical protein
VIPGAKVWPIPKARDRDVAHPTNCMSKSSLKIFTHKRNLDDSFDSICNLCFERVAANSRDTDLTRLEGGHVCAGFDLGHILRPAFVERRLPLQRSEAA